MIANARRNSVAFTLVELLVVLAIISMLVALLIPTLGKARDMQKLSQCLSNLRQNGVMSNCYMTDNQDLLPMTAQFIYDRPGFTHSITGAFYASGYTSRLETPAAPPMVRSNPLFVCPELGGDTTTNSTVLLQTGTYYRADSKGRFAVTGHGIKQVSEADELSHYAWTILGGAQRPQSGTIINPATWTYTWDTAWIYGRHSLTNNRLTNLSVISPDQGGSAAPIGPYKMFEINKPANTVFSAEGEIQISLNGPDVMVQYVTINSGGWVDGTTSSWTFQSLRHNGSPPVLWGDGHATALKRTLTTADMQIK